jgi:anthranilate phosphoribosyltransferase
VPEPSAPPSITFARIFDELLSPAGPSGEALRTAFDAIFAGAWTPVQVAGFVVALRVRGEDEATVEAAIEAMRAVMVPVEHGLPAVLDTCGTGGDGKGSLNISTAAAIVVAACGLPVAKHGNRSVSSRAGSADVLEALGLPIDLSPARHVEVLRRAGITFLFAPGHHPALRHCGAARRELGIRTLFNALGPIANPARATHQLIGAYEDTLRPILAGALRRLGARHAWVVRGEDGLDEVSPHGPTRVTELSGGRIEERVVVPEDFGMPRSPEGAVGGGDAAENAARIVAILRGAPDPARDAVILNAAAAIAVGREATTSPELLAAAREARAAIDEGEALRALDAWRAIAGGA